jgi:hypothetical protein
VLVLVLEPFIWCILGLCFCGLDVTKFAGVNGW